MWHFVLRCEECIADSELVGCEVRAQLAGWKKHIKMNLQNKERN